MHVERIVAVLEAIGLVVAVVDGVRVRRKHRVYLAELSTEALSGLSNVNGIALPAPSDARWEATRRMFEFEKHDGSSIEKEKLVLSIGTLAAVTVQLDPVRLFVGAGPPISGKRAESYAKAVIHAYRQRVSAAAVK